MDRISRIIEQKGKRFIPAGGIAFYIVIALLVVGAFMIGSLYTEVKYLKSGAGAATAQVANGQAANAPVPTPTVGDVPKITDRDHVRGAKNPQLVMIEYSDFECPYCKTFDSTMQQVMTDYGDKVQWVYRHFPLSIHANAQKEAEASECIYDQGGDTAFWKYADTIFQRTTSNGYGFALDKLPALAAEVGVNEAKFKDCLDSGKFAKYVQDDESGGVTAGIQGTPGTIVMNTKTGDKQLIPGALPYAQVKQILDGMLK